MLSALWAQVLSVCHLFLGEAHENDACWSLSDAATFYNFPFLEQHYVLPSVHSEKRVGGGLKGKAL